jgi:AhpD family alkylhydroperoxidase
LASEKLAPEEFKAWANLDAIGHEGSKSSRKYRELIALAVAHTTQCVYCIQVHAKAAKKARATREERIETSTLLPHCAQAAPARMHLGIEALQ